MLRLKTVHLIENDFDKNAAFWCITKVIELLIVFGSKLKRPSLPIAHSRKTHRRKRKREVDFHFNYLNTNKKFVSYSKIFIRFIRNQIFTQPHLNELNLI